MQSNSERMDGCAVKRPVTQDRLKMNKRIKVPRRKHKHRTNHLKRSFMPLVGCPVGGSGDGGVEGVGRGPGVGNGKALGMEG